MVRESHFKNRYTALDDTHSTYNKKCSTFKITINKIVRGQGRLLIDYMHVVERFFHSHFWWLHGSGQSCTRSQNTRLAINLVFETVCDATFILFHYAKWNYIFYIWKSVTIKMRIELRMFFFDHSTCFFLIFQHTEKTIQSDCDGIMDNLFMARCSKQNSMFNNNNWVLFG